MSEIQNTIRRPIITGRPDAAQKTVPQQPGKTQRQSFGDLLQKSMQQAQAPTRQLIFSKHAQARTLQRGIALSETDLDRLESAVGKAEDKGLTDTLVLMDNKAFIVNVPSGVVVTVVDGNDANGNVFTNINGAVIMD